MGTRTYSHSHLQCYKACPLKFKLTYIENLVKVDNDKSEHNLIYGQAIHEGLKQIYLGDSLEASQKAFKTIYHTQLDPDDTAKTQANGLEVLKQYVARWAEEDKKWKVLSADTKDIFEYGDDEFKTTLDLVIENKEYGGIYGVDHKTAGGNNALLSYQFWNQFEPNSQITKYSSYIKSKYGDCSGFYINAIGIRFLKNKYKDSPAGLNLRFQRQMFNRTDQQMKDEEADSKWWIDRIEQSRESGYYGTNTDSCKFCGFRPICSSGWTMQNDEDLILVQYKREKSLTHSIIEKE